MDSDSVAAAWMWLGRQCPDQGIRARQGAEQLLVVRRQLVHDAHQLLDIGPQLGERVAQYAGFLGQGDNRQRAGGVLRGSLRDVP